MTLSAIACPLCGQMTSFIDIAVPDTDQHIKKYGSLYAGKTISEWKICGGCGFVHQNPRPSIEDLNEFYTHSQYHEQVERDVGDYMRFARWYYSEKIAYTLRQTQVRRGAVFDIGCGLGGVLKLYEELGWRCYGVEPDQGQARFAREDLSLSGVQHGILDGNFHLDEQVDLIFSNHAFEHFADLDQVMQGVKNILKPGGYLFIAIPTYYKNKTSLSKRWMNSAHYSLFTHKSLNNLLSRYGLKEVCHTYSGWIKEADDLWYLARYTGEVSDPAKFYEDPQQVLRYLNVVNPVRTFFLYPVFMSWKLRVRVKDATAMLIRSPRLFARKVKARIRALFGIA